MSRGSQFDLNKLLAGVQLPALPQSAMRLLELSHKPENGPAEFAAAIESDPGLTGQILKFVNSSYFGFSREIASIQLAITLIGVRTVKNFALWSAVFSLMPNPKCGPFELYRLWQDSLRRGLFARAFSKFHDSKDSDEAFASALLQDMAVPLLAKEMPAEYCALLEQRDRGRQRLSDLEQARFGWNHAQAGGLMARMWNLPTDFATLIEEHTAIESLLAADGNTNTLQSAVRLSALLPAGHDEAWTEAALFERAYQRLRPASGPSLLELLERVDRDFEQFAPVLKISMPAKSLVESYSLLATATT